MMFSLSLDYFAVTERISANFDYLSVRKLVSISSRTTTLFRKDGKVF